MRTAVVLAGGLGTRVATSPGRLPKALVPVAGRPFLDHKLAELARLGVERVVLLLGAHADQVIDHLEGWRGSIRHPATSLTASALRGTGGAIKHAADLLGDDHFWVTYGDTLLDADLAAASGSAVIVRSTVS